MGITSLSSDLQSASISAFQRLMAALAMMSAPLASGALGQAPIASDSMRLEAIDIGELLPERDAELVAVQPFWEANAGSSGSIAEAGEGPSGAPSAPLVQPNGIGYLDRPLTPDEQAAPYVPLGITEALSIIEYERDPPLGFSGPSGITPTEWQESAHFVPIEDRWRIGLPEWDRYGDGHPYEYDYPFVLGRLSNPYNQNVLKGDYPILGQHLFLNLTVMNLTVNEFREVPTPTTPFESTARPFSEEFFGDPFQAFYVQTLRTSVDLFHGNTAFKPIDWRVKLEPVFNINLLNAEELGVVSPDVRRGSRRTRDFQALEQWFVEAKLADLGPDYDFLSTRIGSQPFTSDFRGFVFKDINSGVRLFGTRFANRDQFNLVYFDQREKETNSELNSFRDRDQSTLIANYFRQDFVFPGFTGLLSFHYNSEEPSTEFDSNGFLVRPDPAGVFREHQVDAYYLGVGGDGHIGRVNVSTQFYHVFGRDSLNPIGGSRQTIDAQMAALELSYDRDWIRFRTSYFYASGDEDPTDYIAGGFDTILDDPVFAGGEFSYWQRQGLRLFGVGLTQRKSLVPNLRSSKIQGQSNFVNPGLHLFNLGMDFEVTQKLRMVANANYLWFDRTAVLETFTFQSAISDDIGADLSLGAEYRPTLSDNIIFVGGVATLLPGAGFDDLFGVTAPFEIENVQAGSIEADTKYAAFVEMFLTY